MFLATITQQPNIPKHADKHTKPYQQQQPPHEQSGYPNQQLVSQDRDYHSGGQGYPQQPYPPHQQSYGAPSGPGAYADPGHQGGPGPGGAGEGEKGLGATLIGSAGGGFLGHQLGGGALGTIGGMIAGAVGANVLENKHEKYASPH